MTEIVNDGHGQTLRFLKDESLAALFEKGFGRIGERVNGESID
jgi:hypothetical protein